MVRKFSVSALSPNANRAAFDCGVIAGYYTLASATKRLLSFSIKTERMNVTAESKPLG